MIIRTALGDIAPANFEPCEPHEHPFLTRVQPGEEFLDDWSRFVAALQSVGYDHVLSVELEVKCARGRGAG